LEAKQRATPNSPYQFGLSSLHEIKELIYALGKLLLASEKLEDYSSGFFCVEKGHGHANVTVAAKLYQYPIQGLQGHRMIRPSENLPKGALQKAV
jgi:hypothetical protein